MPAVIAGLILSFFLTTLNAHACLVPFFSSSAAPETCPMSAEQPDQTFCNTFTAVGIDAPMKVVEFFPNTVHPDGIPHGQPVAEQPSSLAVSFFTTFTTP